MNSKQLYNWLKNPIKRITNQCGFPESYIEVNYAVKQFRILSFNFKKSGLLYLDDESMEI